MGNPSKKDPVKAGSHLSGYITANSLCTGIIMNASEPYHAFHCNTAQVYRKSLGLEDEQ
jgi:hypothetical protein